MTGMKMKVKDFTIEPVLCPINMKDCSACKHAGAFKVRNPPTVGTAKADFGEHDCFYFDWFQREFESKKKETL